jgi:hypothetical protein
MENKPVVAQSFFRRLVSQAKSVFGAGSSEPNAQETVLQAAPRELLHPNFANLTPPLDDTFSLVPHEERRRSQMTRKDVTEPDGTPITDTLEVAAVSDMWDYVVLERRRWDIDTSAYVTDVVVVNNEELAFIFHKYSTLPNNFDGEWLEREIMRSAVESPEGGEEGPDDDFASEEARHLQECEDYLDSLKDDWDEVSGPDRHFVSYYLSGNATNSLDNEYASIWIDAVNGRGQARVIETVHNSWTDAESTHESEMPMAEALAKVRSYRQEAMDQEHAKLRGDDLDYIADQIDADDDSSRDWRHVDGAERKLASYKDATSSQETVFIRAIEILAYDGDDTKIAQHSTHENLNETYTTYAVVSAERADALVNSYRARMVVAEQEHALKVSSALRL